MRLMATAIPVKRVCHGPGMGDSGLLRPAMNFLMRIAPIKAVKTVARKKNPAMLTVMCWSAGWVVAADLVENKDPDPISECRVESMAPARVSGSQRTL